MKTPDETAAMLAKINAHQGVIGINDSLEVFDGYDGRLDAASHTEPQWVVDNEDREAWLGTSLTQAEKLNLADEMIRRWTKYRDLVGGK